MVQKLIIRNLIRNRSSGELLIARAALRQIIVRKLNLYQFLTTYLRVHEHGRTVGLRLFNHHVDNTTGDSERKRDLNRTGILVKEFASRFHQAVQVQLGKDNFQTAFQVSHTILLVRVMFHDVFNCLIGNDNLLRLECHF